MVNYGHQTIPGDMIKSITGHYGGFPGTKNLLMQFQACRHNRCEIQRYATLIENVTSTPTM